MPTFPMPTFQMRLSTSIKLMVVLWLVAEVLAFVFVADLIGYPETLLVTFLTSLFGWTLLKRAGASAQVKLRAALGGRRVVDGGSHRFLDETLSAVGALALLMPGFLSDIIGLALAVPAARDRVAGWLGASRLAARWSGSGGAHRAPTTIDLDPEEWRRTGPSRRP